MSKFKRILWVTLPLLLLAASCSKPSVSRLPPNNYQTPFHIGSSNILVGVADNDETRERGLSGRDSLTDQQGMLFDFSDIGPTKPGFWMKDMKFALDFVWINNNKVVGITPNVPTPTSSNTQLPIYYPPSDVTQMLEVNAGWTAKHNIKVGDDTSR